MKKILTIVLLLFGLLTIGACDELDKHTVSFVVDNQIYQKISIKEGSYIDILPDNPIKEGYRFVGWLLDDAFFNFENPIESDLTLSAKFVIKYDGSIVISKLYTATKIANNIIELYNNSDEVEDLSAYSLNFYQNGSSTVTKSITLSGIIPANGYFVIAGSNFREDDYLDTIDFTFEEGSLPYNGDDVIELVKGELRADIIGHVGHDLNFSKDLTLIRLGKKEDYQPLDDFNSFNFITYLPDVFEYLKNDEHKIQTLEDLYAGPKLADFYKELPYANGDQGTGGAVKATLQGIADGDTATFNYNNKGNSMSHRYYYINTPEVDGGNVRAEPWGYVASEYNKEHLLKNASTKEIYVQSVPNYALTETYNRNIGLIWINNSLSQFLIVSEGLSDDVPVSFGEIDLLLYWENVPYLTFFTIRRRKSSTKRLGHIRISYKPRWRTSAGLELLLWSKKHKL